MDFQNCWFVLAVLTMQLWPLSHIVCASLSEKSVSDPLPLPPLPTINTSPFKKRSTIAASPRKFSKALNLSPIIKPLRTPPKKTVSPRKFKPSASRSAKSPASGEINFARDSSRLESSPRLEEPSQARNTTKSRRSSFPCSTESRFIAIILTNSTVYRLLSIVLFIFIQALCLTPVFYFGIESLWSIISVSVIVSTLKLNWDSKGMWGGGETFHWLAHILCFLIFKTFLKIHPKISIQDWVFFAV